MKTQTKSRENNEPYYDIDDDWGLIYASFQSQYGIRLSQALHGMSWREFSYLVNGLSGNTPLGQAVAIRAEDDPEMLKDFTPDQRRFRAEYRTKIANKKSDKEVDSALDNMKKAFIKMAK